jgi:MraZ protein
MFSGRYEYTIDDKGRLSIPSKFRDALLSHDTPALVLTNHLDGCVVAYPAKEWEALQDRIERSGAALKKEAKNVLRFFYSGATECPIDRLGRILVPQTLRNYGTIKKNVVIVGMNKKIEIWAEEAWSELVKQAISDREKMTDTAAELGF